MMGTLSPDLGVSHAQLRLEHLKIYGTIQCSRFLPNKAVQLWCSHLISIYRKQAVIK